MMKRSAASAGWHCLLPSTACKAATSQSCPVWAAAVCRGTMRGRALYCALTFIMPCQSKLSTLIGALGQDLRTVRTPSEKCSESMSSSWRCRQDQGVSAGQLAGSAKQIGTVEDFTQHICNTLEPSCGALLPS